jgi:Ca-activated chloride channel family protein
MNRSHKLSEREVERLLSEAPPPAALEPPADLLARLKNDIPTDLRLVLPDEAEPAPPAVLRPWSGWPRQRWLMAASLLLVVGAGWLALRVRESAPPMADEAVPALETAVFPEAPEGAPPASRAESDAGPVSAVREAFQSAPPPPAAAVPRPAPSARRAPGAPRVDLKEEITVSAESPLLDQQQASVYRTAPSRPKDALPAVQPRREPAISPEARRRRQREEATLSAEEKTKLRALGYVGADSDSDSDAEAGRVSGVAGSVVGGAPGGMVGVAPPPPPAAAPAPSTGGTAEPNDQPYGDVFFRSAGVNPFVDADEDRFSTFGLDVDTASWTVTRRYLDDGHLPPPEAVRTEEFVNFFDYGDKPPTRGDFALRAEGAPTPFAGAAATAAAKHYRLLRFGLKAREVSLANRKPAVLTFVVDVSGSMAQENRLELVKQTLGLLLGQLRKGDEVGLVVYGSAGRVLLEPTGDLAAIRRALDRLVPDGSTNAEEGIALGYDVARRSFRPGAINRLVLCSDGVANVGATGPESILGRVERESRQGIDLTTVGFGMGNYNDVLMEQLADKGDGRYAYVDSLDEARRVFVEELTGTLQTVARDAKVQVEFNPAVVARYRLLGYENRDIADEDFRNDDIDAGEVGAGHGVTALYEVKLLPEARPREVLATLRLRYRSADTDRVVEVDRELLVRDLATDWKAAPASLRLAATVAELAEILRGSYWAKGSDLGTVARLARDLARELADTPQRERVADFAHLALRAARLRPGVGPAKRGGQE